MIDLSVPYPTLTLVCSARGSNGDPCAVRLYLYGAYAVRLGVEPFDLGSSKPPGCRLCPRQGLYSLQTKVTNYSDQFDLPVQFLETRIQLAIPLCQLVHFSLQLSD
jgi:hypothetical protein